jgi:hypothetical protein
MFETSHIINYVVPKNRKWEHPPNYYNYFCGGRATSKSIFFTKNSIGLTHALKSENGTKNICPKCLENYLREKEIQQRNSKFTPKTSN